MNTDSFDMEWFVMFRLFDVQESYAVMHHVVKDEVEIDMEPIYSSRESTVVLTWTLNLKQLRE